MAAVTPERKAVACIGYDDNGKAFRCPNLPGTPWTPVWCQACDEKRRARITRQLEEIQASFGGKP